jgi:tetratricopeptide (TPR) repeat protein
MYLLKFAALVISIIATNNLYAATKTFEREYTYRASDNDSKNSARAIATTEMRNILLREVGEHIKAERRSANGEYSEKIEAITAGLIEMKTLAEDWDGKIYYIKASMTIDPKNVERRIKEILNDKEKTKQLEAARRRINDIEAEIVRLKKELAKKPNTQAAQQKYTAAAEKLSAEEYFTKGNNAYRNDFYELAIEYYQKSIDIEPNADNYYGIGSAYHKFGNQQQALTYYLKSLEFNPNNAEVYESMAWAYNNQEKRINCLQKAIDIAPNNAGKYYERMAYIYEDDENYSMAILCLQKAIDTDPKNTKTDKFTLTEGEYKKNAWNYWRLGGIYKKQNDERQAERCFLQAIKIDPDFGMAYIELSSIYQKEGMNRLAIDCYQKLTLSKYKENRRVAYHNMGLLYARFENYPEAIRCYQKAIEIYPNDAANEYSEMGDAYYQQENYQKAIQCFQNAVKINPDHIDAWYYMGNAYYAIKNYTNAIKYYQKAVAITPVLYINHNKANAYYNMGLAYDKQGNTIKKAECFKKAAVLGDTDAQEWLQENGYDW